MPHPCICAHQILNKSDIQISHPARSVCAPLLPLRRLAGFPESMCGNQNTTQPVLEPFTVPDATPPAESPSLDGIGAPSTRLVTWKQIAAADKYIASRLISMTLRYGYDLDPSAHPVLPATALYAAGRVAEGPGAVAGK